MILKIHRISLCKCISDKCEYKVEVEKKENVNITNKVKPNDEPYDGEEEELIEDFDQTFIKELHDKLKYLGESPSSSDTRDVYNYLFEKLIKSKKSKYEDEILNLQQQSYDSMVWYTIGAPLPDGNFSSEQYISSWYFTVNKCEIVYLIHNFNDDKGCGCFSSSYPLAVFSDQELALNFMKKCNDFKQKDNDDCGETYFYLDMYEL